MVARVAPAAIINAAAWTHVDLAWTILCILCQIERTGWQDRYAGLVHACGTGDARWYELAVQTFQAETRHGLTPPDIVSSE